jgi:hypothetical protein
MSCGKFIDINGSCSSLKTMGKLPVNENGFFIAGIWKAGSVTTSWNEEPHASLRAVLHIAATDLTLRFDCRRRQSCRTRAIPGI